MLEGELIAGVNRIWDTFAPLRPNGNKMSAQGTAAVKKARTNLVQREGIEVLNLPPEAFADGEGGAAGAGGGGGGGAGGAGRGRPRVKRTPGPLGGPVTIRYPGVLAGAGPGQQQQGAGPLGGGGYVGGGANPFQPSPFSSTSDAAVMQQRIRELEMQQMGYRIGKKKKKKKDDSSSSSSSSSSDSGSENGKKKKKKKGKKGRKKKKKKGSKEKKKKRKKGKKKKKKKKSSDSSSGSTSSSSSSGESETEHSSDVSSDEDGQHREHRLHRWSWKNSKTKKRGRAKKLAPEQIWREPEDDKLRKLKVRRVFDRRPGGLFLYLLYWARERQGAGRPATLYDAIQTHLATYGSTKSPLKTPRDVGEGQTLLQILDAVKLGEWEKVADLAAGRFLALEASLQPNVDWKKASEWEVRDEVTVSVTGKV